LQLPQVLRFEMLVETTKLDTTKAAGKESSGALVMK
jgi:hypothetical protein